MALSTAAENALKASAVFWFVVAVAGQWAFYYIIAFYGTSVLSGDFEVWNRLAAITGRTSYVAGNTAGNLTSRASWWGMKRLTVQTGGLQSVPKSGRPE